MRKPTRTLYFLINCPHHQDVHIPAVTISRGNKSFQDSSVPKSFIANINAVRSSEFTVTYRFETFCLLSVNLAVSSTNILYSLNLFSLIFTLPCSSKNNLIKKYYTVTPEIIEKFTFVCEIAQKEESDYYGGIQEISYWEIDSKRLLEEIYKDLYGIKDCSDIRNTNPELLL